MSLLPYALRPRVILRKQAIERSVRGRSVFWRALALYFVRGPGIVRANAFRRGLLGGNRKWQAVGLVVLLTQDARSVFVKQPEFVAEERMRPGQILSVTTSKPLSRKEQKRTGITRKVLERQALAEVAAAAKAADPTS
jgi:hypothetical protein